MPPLLPLLLLHIMRPRRVRFSNGATNLLSVRLYTAQYGALNRDFTYTRLPSFRRREYRRDERSPVKRLNAIVTQKNCIRAGKKNFLRRNPRRLTFGYSRSFHPARIPRSRIYQRFWSRPRLSPVLARHHHLRIFGAVDFRNASSTF